MEFTMKSIMHEILSQVVDTIKNRVPILLELSSKAMRRLPIPVSAQAIGTLDIYKVLALAPFVAAVIAVAITLAHKLNMGSVTAPRYCARYWLTRRLILRAVGGVYFFAFWTACFQGRAIYGIGGLMPVLPANVGSSRPTPAFHFLSYLCGCKFNNAMLELVSWIGLIGSAMLAMNPARSMLIPILLWILYLSVVNLETIVMNYGWEWLTLELGFLAIFLCPIVWPPGFGTKFPRHHAPPVAVLWLFRWCAFRLLIGAGMSKVGARSSACWKELSCTKTHYFTQPMPNRLSWLAHQAPDWFHEFEVGLTFFEQLVLPFFTLVPVRWIGIVAGLLEILFQLAIVATGNYAWINFVGALPCLALFDDDFLKGYYNETELSELVGCQEYRDASIPAKLMPRSDGSVSPYTVRPRQLGPATETKLKSTMTQLISWMWRKFQASLSIGLVCFIAFKSIAPLEELFAPAPWLHFYDDYFFVNSQGVFGFINSRRVVPILSITHDIIVPTADCKDKPNSLPFQQSCAELAQFCGHPEHGATIRSGCKRSCGYCKIEKEISWYPIEFKNLPGDVHKSAYFNSPYHYRLDWEVWIHTTASMNDAAGTYHNTPSILKLLINKIFEGNFDTIGLLATPESKILNSTNLKPPSAVALQYFLYDFTSFSEFRDTGAWWKRKKLGKPAVYINELSDKSPRRTGYWQKNWIMWWCSIGLAYCLSIEGTSGTDTLQGITLLFMCYIVTAGVTFVGGFPDELPSVYKQMGIVTKLTGVEDSTVALALLSAGTSFSGIVGCILHQSSSLGFGGEVDVWRQAFALVPILILSFTILVGT